MSRRIVTSLIGMTAMAVLGPGTAPLRAQPPADGSPKTTAAVQKAVRGLDETLGEAHAVGRSGSAGHVGLPDDHAARAARRTWATGSF